MVSHLSSPTTSLATGLVAQWLFRVPPCRNDTIHLRTSMPSPGFEPRQDSTVSIANHYTEWTTEIPAKSRNASPMNLYAFRFIKTSLNNMASKNIERTLENCSREME
ncbi:hypothetical protein TNCV_1442661 [Trichonephila clavipes]|uniref:Uncharacterized protein n=1 Tax=Trichonephila clavipes TaxID=2585209 RepID=A0A8X6RPF4_TRICX|nr:hypothetical protein TNCV_1442661 [Trichonephila clavipes]